MARKIKPNNLFGTPSKNTGDAQRSASTAELPEECHTAAASEEDTTADGEADAIAAIGADVNPIVGTGRISKADLDKLARYEAMEKSLADLSSQKSMLEARLAEYADKIDSLKDVNSKTAALEARCKDLESKCSAAEQEAERSSSKRRELEKAVEKLQNENDDYLLKISELTFENANLTCQLSELEKRAKASGNVANQNRFKPSADPQPQMSRRLAQPNKDVYNPYANNGYGTW